MSTMAMSTDGFTNSHARRREIRFSSYLFWVLLLLPLDWFAPTGQIFREFGAKPAILLLTLGGLFGMLFLKASSPMYAKRETKAVTVLTLLCSVNLYAYMINILFGWSEVGNARNPHYQFINQSLLIATAALAILGNARVFSRMNIGSILTRLYPRVAAIHLAIWILEISFPSVLQPLLSPFRAGGISLERPTGLLTEPSYYGTMSALFAIPMLLAPQFRGKLFARVVAIGLLASALYIDSKTLIIVAGAQTLWMTITLKRGRLIAMLVMVCIVISASYFIQTRAALNVEENLSSAMRLGSTHLAVNVALTGLALPGIGAGQFHFQYDKRNAPDYLLFSAEALEQMSPQAEGRASTYNFPMRVLVELGVVGFMLVLGGMIAILRGTGDSSRIAQLMLFGSLGFLLTQDTYFYPPLILATALLLATLRTPKCQPDLDGSIPLAKR